MAQMREGIGFRGLLPVFDFVPNFVKIAQQDFDREPLGPRVNVGRRQLALNVALIGFCVLAVVLRRQDTRRLFREIAGLILRDLLRFALHIKLGILRILVARYLDQRFAQLPA